MKIKAWMVPALVVAACAALWLMPSASKSQGVNAGGVIIGPGGTGGGVSAAAVTNTVKALTQSATNPTFVNGFQLTGPGPGQDWTNTAGANTTTASNLTYTIQGTNVGFRLLPYQDLNLTTGSPYATWEDINSNIMQFSLGDLSLSPNTGNGRFIGNFSGNGSLVTALNAGNLSSGVANVARVGTGSGSATTFLNGTGAFTTPASGASIVAGTNMLGATNAGVVTLGQLDRQWWFGNGQVLNAQQSSGAFTSGVASNYMTFAGLGYSGEPSGGKFYAFRGKLQQGSVIYYKVRLVQDIGAAGQDDHVACMSGFAADGGLKAFVGIEQGTNKFEVVDRHATASEVDDVRALPYALMAGSIVGIEEYDTNAPAYGVVTIVISDWTSGSKVILTNFNHVVDTAWTNNYTSAFQGEHSFNCLAEVLQCDIYDATGTNLVCGGPQWITLNGDTPVVEPVTNNVLTMTNHNGSFKTELSWVWLGDGGMSAIFTPDAGVRDFGFAFHSSAAGYRTIFYYDSNNQNFNVARVDPADNLTVLQTIGSSIVLQPGTNYYSTLTIAQGTNYTLCMGTNTIRWSDSNSDFQTGPYKLAGYTGPMMVNLSSTAATMKVQPGYINPLPPSVGSPIALVAQTGGNATNLNVNNLTVTGTATLPAASFSPTVLMTNYISGQIYTNLSGATVETRSAVVLTNAAIAGIAGMELQIGNPGGALTSVDFAENQTLSTSLATTNRLGLSCFVTNGGCWTYTNKSVGAGNASGPISGTGQLITW